MGSKGMVEYTWTLPTEAKHSEDAENDLMYMVWKTGFTCIDSEEGELIRFRRQCVIHDIFLLIGSIYPDPRNASSLYLLPRSLHSC